MERGLALLLWRRGWRPVLVPYVGYGASADGERLGWVRVLGRALLVPAGQREQERSGRRGWRHFLTVSLAGVHVQVSAGDSTRVVRTDAGGYIDEVVTADLAPGWGEVTLAAPGVAPVTVPMRVVGNDEKYGVVSDIDDTVMVTAIPRPLLALWNSFVRHETARRPVPGMARFLHRLTEDGPDVFVVYLSTGAWNVAPSLGRFLDRHRYPAGPLLLTDWGPAEGHWFRSGRTHKSRTLRRLVRELPGLRWSLVGDDGQHDPAIYQDLVESAPGVVRLVAIRQLSEAEQVLTHGTAEPLDAEGRTGTGVRRPAGESAGGDKGVPWLRAADGNGLLLLLAGRGRSVRS